MIFRNQFGDGPAVLQEVYMLGMLPENSLIIDKNGQIWKRTIKNPQFGGDMIKIGFKSGDAYICGAHYFAKFLPATILHIPKESMCEKACQYAQEIGANGSSCQEVCVYLCVDEFPE